MVSVHKGRKLMSLHISSSDSDSDLDTDTSHTSTDPNEHMEVETGVRNPPPISGRAILRTCLVCDEMVHSGLALERHMKSRHPLQHPYNYLKCDGSFNNLRELSSHNVNQHTHPKVSCNHCDYCMVSHSWMRMHVRIHTRGIRCDKCQRTFPSATALQVHDKLHCAQRDSLDCNQCDKMYATAMALRIQVQGKHGSGFVCGNCFKCFDSPAQLKRHAAKCDT